MKKKCGQSLIEAVVAVAIVLMLVTGLIVATTSALKYGQQSKLRSTALAYAKEGIEAVRTQRDASWTSFALHSGMYCLSKDLVFTQVDPCPYALDSIFSRSVTYSWDAGNSRMGIVVKVSWVEQNQVRSVTLTSYLTNWRGT